MNDDTNTPPTTPTDAGRRSHGEGTIDQRDNGRFRVRLKLANGSRKSVTYDTEEEAQRMLDAMLSEMAPEEAPTGPMTLRTWGAKWLEARDASGTHRSMGSDRSAWKTRVVAVASFIDRPLATITRRDIKTWLTDLTKKKALAQTRDKNGRRVRSERPLSRQSIVHGLNLLRKALADAIEDEVIPGPNPAVGVKVPLRPTSLEGWTYLTVPEIEAVATCEAIPEADRLIYIVAIHTGLRLGELWGLRWSDVHLTADRPEVVVRYSHKGPTKSGKIRHVPLLPQAHAALTRWAELNPKRVKNGFLVFPTLTGERRQKTDGGGWRTRRVNGKVTLGAKDLAGIKRRVRFHDLRHTCASHLLMGSWGRAWRLEEVCALLGHSEIGVTQRYAHLSADHLHRAASETKVALPVPPATATPATPVVTPTETARTQTASPDQVLDPNSGGSEPANSPVVSRSTPSRSRTYDLRLRKPRRNACFAGENAR